MCIYALIPAFNEARTIYSVVSEVKKYVDEVVVVDDGSLDQTSSEAKRGGAFILRHIVNRGQGAALQTGFDYLKRSNLDAFRIPHFRSEVGEKEGGSISANDFVVVTFDADAQFEPNEIPKLIEPIKNSSVDVVLGSRFMRTVEIGSRRTPQEGDPISTEQSSIPAYKKCLLKCAIILTNLLTGLKLTDTHNGFRALSAKAVSLIIITQDRMAHGSEILFEITKHNLSYQEVPVTVKYSVHSLSKGQKLGDYFKILFDLFIRKLVQ